MEGMEWNGSSVSYLLLMSYTWTNFVEQAQVNFNIFA